MKKLEKYKTARDHNLLFYDSIAADYDSMLNRLPGDRWVRDAFHDLVQMTVERESWLLDFGCGTGTDAQWYVRQGYRVLAYDSSREMITRLQQKNTREITEGNVIPFTGDWELFIRDSTQHPRPRAIVANFAVLNCVADLNQLFSSFTHYIIPSGFLLLSVLNPFFWKDVIRRRLRPQSARLREHADNLRMDTYLYSAAQITDAAHPYFTRVVHAGVGALISYSKGTHNWNQPSSFAERCERRLWRAPPFSHMGKYLFLVFRHVT